MKKYLVIIALCLPALLAAQMTYVPDDNFEQTLIDKGYDTLPLNDSVPTKNIESISSLDVSQKGIKDLTGIEDFTALIMLDCWGNDLISLDVSKNTALTVLACFGNKLMILDVSDNTALTILVCFSNELQDLDVSKNTELERLYCDTNKLNKLDVSNNIKLRHLYCSNNNLNVLTIKIKHKLTELYCNNNNLVSLDLSECTELRYISCYNNLLKDFNLKNMNNNKIGLDPMFRGFDATKNPNLFCIQVDDSSWSENNSLWHKDDHAVYSEDCSLVSVEEETNPINDITLAPNPATDFIEINNVILNEVKDPVVLVYNVLGGKLMDSRFRGNDMRGVGNDIFVSTEGNVRLDISALAQGVYFVKIGGKVSKFVKM